MSNTSQTQRLCIRSLCSPQSTCTALSSWGQRATMYDGNIGEHWPWPGAARSMLCPRLALYMHMHLRICINNPFAHEEFSLELPQGSKVWSRFIYFLSPRPPVFTFSFLCTDALSHPFLVLKTTWLSLFVCYLYFKTPTQVTSSRCATVQVI